MPRVAWRRRHERETALRFEAVEGKPGRENLSTDELLDITPRLGSSSAHTARPSMGHLVSPEPRTVAP